MRRKFLHSGCFLAASSVILVALLAPCSRYVDDGRYKLRVYVSSPHNQPSAVLVIANLYDLHPAERIAKRAPSAFERKDEVDTAFCDPFDGQPIEIYIRFSHYVNITWWLSEYRQARYIVVIACWPDGQQISKAVEISDGRESRVVHLSFP
jgi:hypothetical protein